MASENSIKQKQEEVSVLAEKMKSAKLILLAEYKGINVADVTKLRSDLRKEKTEYMVIKNNITKRALAECKIEGLDDQLAGPVAVIISNEDYLVPSKIIYNFTKDNEYYKIKAGVIEGKVVDGKEIITLAKLPSREVLIAKLAGSLLGNITKLAIAIDQVRVQKEA